MTKSYGWNGAGVGVSLESTYGTDGGAPIVWIPVESEDILIDDPMKPARTILPVAAAVQAARDRRMRYLGIPVIGGPMVCEAMYEHLDTLFHNFFGLSTQSAVAPKFSHVYPPSAGMVDLPSANPGLTLNVDKDTDPLEVLGGFIDRITFELIGEERPKITFEIGGQFYSMPGDLTPSWPSGFDGRYIEGHEIVVALDFDDAGTYAKAFEADGFSLTLDKKMRRAPAHDGSTRGIRQPIREGYLEATGTLARLWDDATDTWAEFRAGDTIGIKLTATKEDGAVDYSFVIEMGSCFIESTGLVTPGEGPRVETLNFSADTDGTNPAVKITTVNNDDQTAW